MKSTTTQPTVEQRLRAKAYADYHADLLDEMTRRPSLANLMHYLRYYGRQSPFLPYAERDAKAPDVKAIYARGCDDTWSQRQWDCRERARAIIEGREPWPRHLLPWKANAEELYVMGVGDMPGWLDPENDPAPHDPTPRNKPKRPADIAKRIQRGIAKRIKGRRR